MASPYGPVQATGTCCPPTADRNASTVPSPPSATGMAQISASGSCDRMASATIWQTSREESVPLKESGIRTYLRIAAPFF